MKVNIGPYTDDAEQVVEVHIDKWDTWSMDHTLAPIILPMLIQLKQTTHGAPNVDLEDVPEGLRPTNTEEWQKLYNEGGETDDKFFERWDWVMDEMIYAFDCKANKDEVYMRLEDQTEIKKEQKRISNGFRLFGKYYESLWDQFMTLPIERKQAVLRTEQFLKDLLNPKMTPRVPRAVREQAYRCLRHYPTEFNLKDILDE